MEGEVTKDISLIIKYCDASPYSGYRGNETGLLFSWNVTDILAQGGSRSMEQTTIGPYFLTSEQLFFHPES